MFIGDQDSSSSSISKYFLNSVSKYFLNTKYNINNDYLCIISRYNLMSRYMYVMSQYIVAALHFSFITLCMSYCSSWNLVSSRLPRQFSDWVTKTSRGLAHSRYQPASQQRCHGCLCPSTLHRWSWPKDRAGMSSRFNTFMPTIN